MTRPDDHDLDWTATTPEIKPKVYVIRTTGAFQQVPLDWRDKHGERAPDPDQSVQVADGVRIQVIGWGDTIVPAGPPGSGIRIAAGAEIAVWTDPEKFRD